MVDIKVKSQDANGAITAKTEYIVITSGSNLIKVMMLSGVDKYNVFTTNIPEYYEILGIDTIRKVILTELLNAMAGASPIHYGIYADEMTSAGIVTPISNAGLAVQERSNVLLRTSFQTPLQILQQAAIDNVEQRVFGVSSALMLGVAPKVGTLYNELVVDTRFIKDEEINVEDL